MSRAEHPYTTQLQAGLGLFDETRTLLELWQPGINGNLLKQAALSSGHADGLRLDSRARGCGVAARPFHVLLGRCLDIAAGKSNEATNV